ncbi:hypothetical protein LS68_007215 [Helicobacter sp. MIT 05-5293]|uniref:PEP-utilizing enzyme n=1 Tax=Helicobacter sp. MIT 05-5293 TaxID=1548149 RepID=UPI00051D956D|nr:PEP-utilizing enzyme [Helicobacter sp. MIT 05-5293]TLD80586.1 hypothetical protein LS68_007215 [Helicobacter sp. MIT 05-5293]
MSPIAFQTKARNLIALQDVLKSAKILPLMRTSLDELKANEVGVLKKIKSFFSQENACEKLIVRSSSCNEDSKLHSNAGAFLSIANVSLESDEAILEALQAVGHSMPCSDDEILIQPMLENISLCGVAFSVDKDNFAPYFCVQYDVSGQSHLVTDGSNKQNFTFTHFREADLPKDERFKAIIVMMKELESLFSCYHLDVEFAFGTYANQEMLFCLQVRPLVMCNKSNFFHTIDKKALVRLHKRLSTFCYASPDVLGDRAIFGVMPDWNPAEIIGLRPKRLALSLYKEIITDNIWAYQRDNYGYRNLRSHPLMHSFLGMPYIDVRLSFNSFIPKDLDEKIARKLMNYYLDSLLNRPELHDKIEFGIVFSCYDFNIAKKLKKLLNEGFSENETKRIEFALLNLTNTIINPSSGLYVKDLAKIENLKSVYERLKDSHLSLIDKIYWLIENCKRYGTLPFAGIARAGFVAMQMLNSLVEIGFLSEKEKHSFLHSLKTVSKELSSFTKRLNEENKEEFLREFGHLRAGTYNILSPRYDEAFESYFGHLHFAPDSVIESEFSLDDARMQELNELLSENGLKIDAKGFFAFLKAAIEGRESAKFAFTKLLSYVISLIGELGVHYGIDKEDMAHLDIKNILTLYSSLYSKSPKDRLLGEIALHKEEHNLTLALKLPPLLRNPDEVFSFFEFHISPNFITQKSVMADIALENEQEVEGKIVLIYAADPGYDYLFAQKIAGLITCYGGANSHMAIRASELGLPAVIGVGERAFEKYSKAHKILIECQSEQIVCL